MERLEELNKRFAIEPLVQLLDAQLVFSSPGQAEVSAAVREGFLVGGGIVQGGIITTIADFAGVYAAMSVIPAGHTPAQHIDITFLRPIMRGETIRASGLVTEQTRGSVWTKVNVFGSADSKRRAFATIHFVKPKA